MALPQNSPTCKEFEELKTQVHENEKAIFKGNGKKSLVTAIDILDSTVTNLALEVKSVKTWQMGIFAALVINVIIMIMTGIK